MSRMIRGLAAGIAAMAMTASGMAQQAGDNEPVLTATYGWEDGLGTILGTNSPDEIIAANVGDFVNTGNRALRLTESPKPDSAPHVYLAHIRNLNPGDIIRAGFWAWDDTPGQGSAGYPSVRIWGHYTVGDDIDLVASAGGNNTFSAGTGWQEITHEWTFSDTVGLCDGDCDGLVIQVRLYSPVCNEENPGWDPRTEQCFTSTDFWIDDLTVEVYCAENSDLEIELPDGTIVDGPLTPGEVCEPEAEPLLCQTPDLFGAYGWEDGEGTALNHNFPSQITVQNTSEFVFSGDRALKITESPNASGTPQIRLVQVRGLQTGDTVNAGFWAWDDTPGQGQAGYPSVRIWAYNTKGASLGSVSPAFPTAQQNEVWSSGIGWEEISHSWEFDSNGGARDGIVVEVRVFNPPCNDQHPGWNPSTEQCSMDYFIDDLWVEVCAAEPDNVTIVFPEPEPVVDPCPEPDLTAGYNWSDGEGTVISATNQSALTIVNQTEFVSTGSNALKVTESPHVSANPQVHLAHVRNLVDGDVITGGFWTYDDTPGQGQAGYPSVRIWAHYTAGSNLSSVSPAIPQGLQNTTFSNGVGWEEITHSWEFDSNGGVRDGLLIHARLFSGTCNDEHPNWDPQTEQCATDYFFDDLSVEVCSSNAENVVVLFPDDFVFEPEPPIEMCKEPMWGAYGWEDGRSTAINVTNGSAFIALANTDELVNSGDHALKITESPNAPGQTPQIHVAFIENLQHGDTIRASVWAFDDTPGNNPVVRIWARYGFTGDPIFLTQSAGGGSETPTSGIGWEELSETWEFDAGSGEVPRDALMIHVRVYAPTCNEENPTWDPKTEECSTDYFIDDLLVEVCSEHPNVTITFPDGTIIGDPAEPSGCIADVDGSGEVDVFDVWAVTGDWGSTLGDATDVNGDMLVDGADLGIVLASFGSCDDFLFPMLGGASLILEDTPVGGTTRQFDLYVELDANEALVNVYNATVTSSLGFQSGSLVTIGDPNHPGNWAVFEDPNFDFFAFGSGTHMGTNAGWYNEDPPNDAGLAGQYPNNRVLIASLLVHENTEFDAELSVTWRDGDGRARQATLTIDDDPAPDCPADLTGSGVVNVFDLLELLAQWGPCADCNNCPADLTGTCVVNVFDLLELLAQWGPCPE